MMNLIRLLNQQKAIYVFILLNYFPTSSRGYTEIRAGAEAIVESSTQDFLGRPQILDAHILHNVIVSKNTLPV